MAYGHRAGGRRPRRDPALLDAAIHAALRAAPRPLGAYDLIGALAVTAPPAPSPVQIYRALDRLMATKRVRRIASVAGYLASAGGTEAVLHCRRCGAAELVPAEDVHTGLAAAARIRGFLLREAVVEMAGVCAACGGDRASANRRC